MRSFAFVVTMLMACGANTRAPQKPQQDCESGGCSVKQDCGSNGCDKQGTATEPVYAGTCDGAACANELSEKFNATQPKPEMDCDTFNCGKTGKAEAAAPGDFCEAPPC